jgi:quinol-cytochrome oxidoreductase complex cytochrome b subunit
VSDGKQTTSQIHDELLNEVKQELVRRGTTLIPAKPEPGRDTLAGLVVSALLAVLAVLAGSGVMMALVYTPTMEDANASTAWFQAGAIGGVVRAAHWHASNLLVLLSGAYLFYLVWRGLFRRPAQWRWWRAALLLGLVLAFSLTGQLLPFDQLALHGTGIRLGYLAEAPVLGPRLVELAQGGESIGNATLARFFGLHAIVLPALTVILLRFLWRDGKSDVAFTYHAAVAGAVLVLVAAAAVLVPAPLGLQGSLSEPYPEARPEWFALPLYALLKLLPPGALHLLVLFVMPLLGAALIAALPFIETVAEQPARLRKPLQIGVIALVVFGLAFSAVPLIQDMSTKEGWFRQPGVEGLMTAMGRRNDALLNSGEAPPAEAHNLARDLQLLHERLVGVYPEKIEEGQKADWDKLAQQGVEAARKLLLAPDAHSQLQAREELRQVCADCHKAHDKEEVKIDPPPRFVARDTGGPSNPPAAFFFDQEQLKSLQPGGIDPKRSTTKQMDQMKYRLRDMLIEAGIISDNRKPDAEKRSATQSLVDLRELTNIVAGHYDDNAGAFHDQAKWDKWIEELRRAMDELAQAKDAADLGRKAAAVGKACEACHDGADEPDEPIEWTFKSMLAGE